MRAKTSAWTLSSGPPTGSTLLRESKVSRPGLFLTSSGGQDTTVKLFNAATGECVRSLSGLEEGIGSISFSPLANGLIAGGGWFGKIIIWEVEVRITQYVETCRSSADRQISGSTRNRRGRRQTADPRQADEPVYGLEKRWKPAGGRSGQQERPCGAHGGSRAFGLSREARRHLDGSIVGSRPETAGRPCE